MITVYSNQGSGNCYKIRLLLSQLGVDFRTQEMDVVAGAPRRSEFLQKNRNGKVPVVEWEDGRCLAESGAILFHFAAGSSLWPEEHDLQTEVLQWMFFEQYSHEPHIAVARFWCHYLDAEEQYREALIEKRENGYWALGVMEEHLSDRRFFVGEQYSIADIALYAYTHVSHQGGFDLERFPAIRSWIRRVSETPGYVSIETVL